MHLNIIYKNIVTYRLIMFFLYRGLYKQRFTSIINLLSDTDRSILEICFGDTCIASHCLKTGRNWQGLDINAAFVASAQAKGLNAQHCDITKIDKLPASDVCIMGGSMYHFHSSVENILSLMLNSAPVVIISEPVKNLSSMKGPVGKIAALASNAGKGAEHFRYNRLTFTDMLEKLSKKLFFTSEIISEGRDLLVKITRN